VRIITLAKIMSKLITNACFSLVRLIIQIVLSECSSNIIAIVPSVQNRIVIKFT